MGNGTFGVSESSGAGSIVAHRVSVWEQYFMDNPGAQTRAFESVLDATKQFDNKYGTDVETYFWGNVLQGNFKGY